MLHSLVPAFAQARMDESYGFNPGGCRVLAVRRFGDLGVSWPIYFIQKHWAKPAEFATQVTLTS